MNKYSVINLTSAFLLLTFFFQNSFSQESERNYLNKGYYGQIEFGYCRGMAEIKKNRYLADLTNGYRINKNFALGLGVGLRYFLNENPSIEPFIPIYLDIFLNSTSRIPVFAKLKVGSVSNSIDLFEYNGFYSSFAIGSIVHVSKGLSINVGMSYEFLRAHRAYWKDTYDYSNYYQSWHYTWYSGFENYSLVCIFAGLAF